MDYINDALERIYEDMMEGGEDTSRTVHLSNGDPLFHRLYLGGQERRVFIHKLVESDVRVHHNHPWDVSTSYILEGRYIDHQLGKKSKLYQPGDANIIYRDNFHFLELIDEVVWTLFIPGKRVGKWGFKLPDGTYVPHDEYMPWNNKSD